MIDSPLTKKKFIFSFIFFPPNQQPHQIITLTGSVRIKTCDLELPQLLSLQSSSSANSTNANTPTQPPHGTAIEGESGRAVDNQYSFV